MYELPFYVSPAPEPGIEREMTMHERLLRELLELSEPLSTDAADMLAKLHPQLLTDELRKRGMEQHGPKVMALAAGGKHSADEVLTLLLKIQFNAFASGFYFSEAMINHSSLRPNAVKLVFEGKEGSFVFALRPIASGEEILISYFAEMERSLLYRQRTLDSQHYFKDGDELLDGEDMLEESVAEKLYLLEKQLDGALILGVVEVGKILQSLLDFLPGDHMIVQRARFELIRAVQEELRQRPDLDLAIMALRCCHQVSLTFEDDPRWGGLADDVEQLLGFALAKNARRVYAEFPEIYGTYSLASKAQYEAKKTKIRIRKMYNTKLN